MKYTVLSEFADLQDKNHIYKVGALYPRDGYTPTAERVDELSTGKNLLHKPLIELIEEPKPQEEEPETETAPEEVTETAESEETAEPVEEVKPKTRRKKNDD